MRKGGSEERRPEKGFLAEVTAQLGADIWRQEDSKRCRSVNPWPWGSMSLRNEVLWGVVSNLRGTQWGLCIRIICSPDSGCVVDLTSRPASYPSMWPWDTPPPSPAKAISCFSRILGPHSCPIPIIEPTLPVNDLFSFLFQRTLFSPGRFYAFSWPIPASTRLLWICIY